MISSMTGFGSKEREVSPYGKVSIECRSSNHKFLEIVVHVPEGYLALEDRIKKEIEAKIKRGRITCSVAMTGAKTPEVYINKALIKNYVAMLKNIQDEHGIKDELSINTLIHLPGVLSLGGNGALKEGIWPGLKILVNRALDDLVKMRQKEGRALCSHLKKRADILGKNLGVIKSKFKKAINAKLGQINSAEERNSFLKSSDITEEIERLAFHIRNFKSKLYKTGPIGKELDFIAQEMQRESNTMAAKTFSVAISGRVVQMKSQIEKIREQVQNIE